MKASTLSTIASLFAGAYAHSWVECVKTEVPNKAEYMANPPDKFSWGPDKEKCHGFPRSVKYRPNGAMTVDPGPWGWNEETVYLTYEVGTLPEKAPSGKTYACPERQRTPEKTWKDKSGAAVEPPVATAKPGESLLMRHWGNGHTTWDPTYANPMYHDPGVIQIYHKDEWDNGSEMFYEDLTEDTWVPGAQGNFSGDAITLYTDEPRPNANAQGTPQKLMIEHANYFTFKIPESMSTGRHTFVWAWRFLEREQSKEPITACDRENFWQQYDIEFTSCFDVEVTAEGDGWAYEGGSGGSSSSAPKSSPAPESSEPEPEAEEPEAEEPEAEEPAVEPAAAEEPSESSGGDICSQPCVIAGAFGTCDPAKESCPTCVIPGGPGGKPSCFDTCEWDGMTDCKRGAKKAKRHGHANVHRRSSRLNRFR